MNNDLNNEQTIEGIDSATEKSNAGKRKKIIAIASSIAVLCVAFVIVLITVIIPKNRYNVGDIVCLGKYEQDNDLTNGKEDIEWIVLAKENGKALLISKYALDFQQFNSSDAAVTWETCTLRKWLNDTFYNNAFGDKEQKKIKTTNVPADKNPNYDSDPGNATKDKIFLLSAAEAEKYFTTDESRICAPTAAHAKTELFVRVDLLTADGEPTCVWWLRTQGMDGLSDNTTACQVGVRGTINYVGFLTYMDYVDSHGFGIGGGVRPAMWIDN